MPGRIFQDRDCLCGGLKTNPTMDARECGFETGGCVFTYPYSSWSHFCSPEGERSWLTELSKLVIDGISPLLKFISTFQDLQVDDLEVLQNCEW